MKIQWLSLPGFMFSERFYGQEPEARAYANLPKDRNVVAAYYAFSKGHVLADASLPIEGFNLKTHTIAFAYVHTVGLADKLARVQVAAPPVHGAGKLRFSGQDTSGTRTGLGDSRIRLGMNLIGSAVSVRKEFGSHKQKTIVGISLAPGYQYIFF